MEEFLGVVESLGEASADMVAVVASKKAVSEKAFSFIGGLAEKALLPISLGDFDGSLGSYSLVYTGAGDAARLLLVGGGGGDDWEDGVERIRVGVGRAVSVARQYKRVGRLSVVIDPSLLEGVDAGFAYREALVAAGLANYSFHRRGKTEAPHRLSRILVVSSTGGRVVGEAMGIVEGVYTARDIANAPPSEMNPEKLEAVARRIAEREGLGIRVFYRSDLESMGMGGILAVGSGSSVEPRLIVLEYNGGSRTVAVVGKAVTFDAGGLDLKDDRGMYDMKFDKSGGAAAIGSIVAAKKLGLPVRVVALIPAVENMPSGSAYKPRDVLHMYNGLTVEVGNTDAEGRLILADALAYAVEKYKPDYLVDLATLTGSIIRALGNLAAGLFSNSEEAAGLVERAAWRVWEPVWRLPLWKPYYRQLESSIADTSNIGGAEAGAITAAAFLSKFVGDTPWVHLDIAGVAWTQKWGPDKPYYPKGATGWGVRTVVEFMRLLSSGG